MPPAGNSKPADCCGHYNLTAAVSCINRRARSSRRQRGDVVALHSSVIGDQYQALGLRLCNKHTVERVAVEEGKVARQVSVIKCRWQAGKAFLPDYQKQVVRGLQFAQDALEGNFPDGNRTDTPAFQERLWPLG